MEYVGMAEIASLLGVSTARVNQISKSYKDFPKPTSVLRLGPVWNKSDIDKWIAAHPHRPTGRPRIKNV